MLAIAIHTDHIGIAQFVSELIAGLHAAAQTEVMRQRKNIRPGGARHRDRAIDRAIVDHQHGRAGHVLANRAHHRAHGAFLVEGRHNHQQGIGTGGASQRPATLRALMEWLSTR